MPGGLFDDFFAEEEKNEDSLQAEAESSETVPSDEVESQEVSEVLVEAASPDLEKEQESPVLPINRIEALLHSDESSEPTEESSTEELDVADPESNTELESVDTTEEFHSEIPAATTESESPESVTGDVMDDVVASAEEDAPVASELESIAPPEPVDEPSTASEQSVDSSPDDAPSESPLSSPMSSPESDDVQLDPAVLEKLNNTSKPFEQRWNSLISTTNWEKGAIIQQWREALIADDAPVTEYSDDTWAQRVGGVSGQHVGRLRRVFARFGQLHQEFGGLYWSHFHATIDWDDAELWLEGAVQNKWSVSQMREQRWEATGADASQKPKEEDITHSVIDEDYLAPAIGRDGGRPYKESDSQNYQGSTGPVYDGPDFGDGSEKTPTAASSTTGIDAVPREVEAEFGMATADETPVQPFRDLATLPEDLAEAFDMFKLGILRHKSAQWEHVKLEAVLSNLDALKQLATAPSMDTGAPF